jgi:cellulose synthase/poly-beta-1,6-N-acetylglucosamine synthase-like glycosyltransferase
MSVSPTGALLVGLGLMLLAIVVLWPLKRGFDDSDKGEGQRVVLPRPRPVSLWRTASFLAIAAVLGAVVIGMRRPNLLVAYSNLVQGATNLVVRAPALVGPYVHSVAPIVPLASLTYAVSFACVLRASPGRRLMVVAHGLLLLVVSAAAETVLSVGGVVFHVSQGPHFVMILVTQMLVAFVVLFRLSFTTFQFPRVTPIPRLRATDGPDSILAAVAIAISITAVLCLDVYLLSVSSGSPAVGYILLLSSPQVILVGFASILNVFRLLGDRPPEPGAARSAVDVIIPAYNEEANIVRLLASVDRAAGFYGGPVHVVLCDDGSTDSTHALASSAIGEFQWATGQIIDGVHAGKARALNLALSACTADLVIRIDADGAVHDHAIAYSVPWFHRYPEVGSVGAFSRPHRPYVSWIQRMRMFELCYAYGFARPGYAVVDGVPCIPGTFTAFRRHAALQVGGFVEGMNGEDVIFTYDLARLGYRAVVDTRVVSFEDAPENLGVLREQRIRWNRGRSQTFARYTPFATGFAGPRFWLLTFRAAGKALAGPLHLAIFVFGIELAFFDPTFRRNPIYLVVIFLIAKVPILLARAIAAAWFGESRRIPWLVCWYVFMLCKRVYSLEALLTLPTRRVSLSQGGRLGPSVPTSAPSTPGTPALALGGGGNT